MKNRYVLMATLCVTMILSSCGGSQHKKGIEDENDLKAIDACTWLTKADAEAILGTTVGNCKVLVSSTSEDKRSSVSQVAYYSEPNQSKHVGLLIKRSPYKSNPTSKTEYANQNKTEDVMGAGNEMYEAIQQGQDISGLGDLAFSYEMIGHNLIVFWKGNHMMIITVYGEDNEKTLDLQKTIASKVIQNL